MSRFNRARNVIDEYVMARNIREITIATNSGLTEVKTGTGWSTMTPSVAYVATGTTPASTTILYSYLFGMYPASTTLYRGNLTKRKALSFMLSISGDNAQIVRYVQIRQDSSAPAYEDLGAAGFGIKLSNLALIGESYGSEHGEVALMNLTAALMYLITIDHDPVAGRIDWYVNGVLKGSQTTATKVPNATPTAPLRFVASIGNGTAEVDGRLYFSPIRMLEGV